MAELKYRKELLLKTKNLNRTKNDKFIPLTASAGTQEDRGAAFEPKRILTDKDTTLKAGDRILHKKSAKSGRSIYNDPSIFDN